ncbi:hypothetical protein GM3708_1126 [Geminocystis sp. NIES-3708]|uniref:hypothetical protein n=1 Tax=Geminocystis sp. NIES-3708 TaxID=1615909 RepID=UPI0005FC8210|nr:hypothetical protein [Geminocystis sp. NIES-3708]BAQ60720.1 hypothetical protein GM3708_1126 [Geminocystis sp. NIES-3708]
MKLYVIYGNQASNQWKKVGEFELNLFINRDFTPIVEHEILTLNSQEIILFNGGKLQISVSYARINRDINIIVISDNKTLINVGGFKSSETSYDPSIIFLTPQGQHLSLMIRN